MFSGLMSGLTLGLMSLSLVDLEVIKKSGTPEDRMNAAKIIPVVQRQHLLLVTLLVGNAVAMEALPLFLDSLVDTWMAILLSVTLLLMFGEILPQAICTRYGLAVGATMAPVVRVLLVIMFPIAWPVSKLLDKILGEKHSLFRRAELITLVHMHGNEAGKGGELSRHETNLIAGTLELAGKTAADAMTPVASVVSIDGQSGINEDVMNSIVASGHSRIPVYFGRRNNIIGLVFVKNFLNVTIDQQTKLPSIDVPIRRIQWVSADMPLHDVLHEFCQRRSHMAVVVRSSTSFQEKKFAEPSAESTALGASKMAPYTESRCASGDRTEDQAERNQSKEAKATNENGAQRSSNNFIPPNFGICDDEPWASRMGEEGDDIVGIITREDVLEELLKESLNLHMSDTKVTIVDDRDFTKVFITESPNTRTSLPTLLHHSRTQFRSMDESEVLSVSDLRSNASASAMAPPTKTSNKTSSFTCGSPNKLHIALSFPPTIPLSAPSPPTGPGKSGQQTPRRNEGVQSRLPTPLGTLGGQEFPVPTSK